MGPTASRALTQKLNDCATIAHTRLDATSGMALDHEPPGACSVVLTVICSLAGSLAFLVLVGIAAWIIISPGSGYPTSH